MPRPEKFPIYAYDGIPPEALVQESPLLMPRAHETKVPNFMRGCWRTWEMDQPANFTRFERCKSFIPIVPPLIALLLSAIAIFLWPFWASAFYDLDGAWSRAPIADIRPILATPLALSHAASAASAAAAGAAATTFSADDALTAAASAAVTASCPATHPYEISTEQALRFAFWPAGYSTATSLIWPVRNFMGVLFCARLSKLDSAAERERAAPGTVPRRCPTGHVLCGQDSCYPSDRTDRFECPVTSFLIEALPDAVNGNATSGGDDGGRDGGNGGDDDTDPDPMQWEWESHRWQLTLHRNGAQPLSHIMFAAGLPPKICRNQATDDEIDRRCGAPGTHRVVDPRYFPMAKFADNLERWVADNGFRRPGEFTDMGSDEAAVMGLAEPPWAENCEFTRRQVLVYGRAAQRRGFAALLAVGIFSLSFLIATAIFVRHFYRRRRSFADHETESRSCAHFFASYLIAVIAVLSASVGMGIEINNMRSRVYEVVEAACGDAETMHLLQTLVDAMRAPVQLMLPVQVVLGVVFTYQLTVLLRARCRWRAAAKYL